LKWAGGKGRIAPAIAALAPPGFGRYHEPFAGAAAVFFAMDDLHGPLSGRAGLSDANAELIACFETVRDAPADLVAALTALADAYLPLAQAERRAFYYEQRAGQPCTPVGRAARLIFLNKTCYNGLYRVNASGGFNVPHGRYARPRIADQAALTAASRALQGVALHSHDFEKACAEAGPGDFVYLDPPYQPLSATSRFTGYTSGEFGPAQQLRLRDCFAALAAREVYAVLSNSDHEAVRALYPADAYHITSVPMSRAINSRATQRAPIPELLIANFTLDAAGQARFVR
jgi:DNA adenine methylase